MSEETIGAPNDVPEEAPRLPPDRGPTPEEVEAEQRENPHHMGHQPALVSIPPSAWGERLGYAQQTGEGDPIGYPVEDPWWVHKALNEAERLAAMPGSDVPGLLGHNIRRWGLISRRGHDHVYFTACEECAAVGMVVVRNPWSVPEGAHFAPSFIGPLFQRHCAWEGT